MIAVVTCTFGGRNDELIRFIDRLHKQNAYYKLFVATTNVCDNSDFIYVPNAPADIWHKEALFNIAGVKAIEEGFEKLIFMDCDIFSNDSFWIEKISNLIGEYSVVHGFRTVIDTVDNMLHFQSPLAGHCLGFNTDLPYNPGMCWGMSSGMFSKMGGFNTYFIKGGGDGGFYNEMFPTFRDQIETVDELLRNFDDAVFVADPECVDVDIFHDHHGNADIREYDKRKEIYFEFSPILDYVRMGRNNLMEWR